MILSKEMKMKKKDDADGRKKGRKGPKKNNKGYEVIMN